MMPTIYIRKFPADLHKELKLEVIRRETTLREAMVEAVRMWLKAKPKK